MLRAGVPIIGIVCCCAPAASGHAAATPPSSVINSRRLMPDMGLPPAQEWSADKPKWSFYRRLNLPQSDGQVLGANLNRSE